MKTEKRRKRAKKKAKESRIFKYAHKYAQKTADKLTSRMSKEQQIRGLRNLIDARKVSRGKVKQEIIKASEEDMRKQIKLGKATTVEALTKTLDNEPEFMELCEKVGLDRKFFEGLAKTVIKEEEP